MYTENVLYTFVHYIKKKRAHEFNRWKRKHVFFFGELNRARGHVKGILWPPYEL